MATHDYVLDNASGAAFRSDLNNCLDAIVTQNVTTDGNAPATVKDWMIWTDKQGGYRKIYNADTSSWVKIGKLDGGAEYSGDVQFKDASSVQMQWDSSDSTLEFGGYTSGGVETALTFGANFAHNVALFHDGSTRIYANVGSVVTNLITAGTDFRIHSGASDTSNHLAKFSRGGGATLYWDGTSGAGAKFATTATGVAVDGLITANTMTLASNLSIAGALQYTTAGNKTLDVPTLAGNQTFELRHQDGSTYENALKATANAGVELYYNGVKTLETTGNGARIIGPTDGEAHLELWSDNGAENPDKWRFVVPADSGGNHLHLQNYATGAWGTNIVVSQTSNYSSGESQVQLYHNGALKFATVSYGIFVTGTTHSTTGYTWGTAPHLLYATSATEANLRIGTTSGNHLYARFAYDPVAGDFEIGNASGNVLLTVGNESTRERAIRCINNGAVELYNNGNVQAITTTHGLGVRRNLDISLWDANATHDCTLQIGSSAAGLTVGDHNSFIDLISRNQDASGPDYDFRIIRYPGTNGSADIINNGTGTLRFLTPTAGGQIMFPAPGAQGTYAPQIPQAAFSFNGGSVTSFHKNYNVSSITDNGIGDYTIYYTSAIRNADHSTVTCPSIFFFSSGPVNTSGTDMHCIPFLYPHVPATSTATGVRIRIHKVDNSDATADGDPVCGLVYG